MKKAILIITATISTYAVINAQDAYTEQMQQQVAKLDNATTVKDYQQLSGNFLRIADAEKTQWLPYYYAAFCNATNPDNPRAIYLEGWEKFSTPKMWGGDKTKAKELLTSAKQKLDNNTSPGIEPHWGKKEVDELLKQLNKQ